MLLLALHFIAVAIMCIGLGIQNQPLTLAGIALEAGVGGYVIAWLIHTNAT